MAQEIVDALSTVPAGVFVDATVGGGGHAAAVLESRADLSLIGIDRDEDALEAAAARLAPFTGRFQLHRARFDQLGDVVSDAKEDTVSGVLFDLGVSSPQLDRPERGFSYREEGPLDMRMSADDTLRADDIVNTWDTDDIADLLRDLGDERFAGRIARAIEAARPISNTLELAEIVREAIPAATRRTGGHPAKRTFQAIRIAVNDELDQIAPALTQSIDLLCPRGRGAVLAYHSGEDRIVKQLIADEENDGCTCPPRLPCVCRAEARVHPVAPKMRRPQDDELAKNRRSSSARLRIFERTEAGRR